MARLSAREPARIPLLRCRQQSRRRRTLSLKLLFLVWICSLATFALVQKLPALALAQEGESDEHAEDFATKRSAGEDFARDEGRKEARREESAPNSSSSRESNGAASSPSLLVLCTADGTLYAIDAWTGKLSSTIRTEALLVRSSSLQPSDVLPMTGDDDQIDDDDDGAVLMHSTDRGSDESSPSSATARDDADNDKPAEDDSDSSSSSSSGDDDDVFVDGIANYPSGSILPGLDGNLYYWLESAPDDDRAGSDGDDDDRNRFRRRNRCGGELTQLPITMEGLLDRPVQTCGAADLEDDQDSTFSEWGEEFVDQECGILTATLDTSLLAMNERGELLWRSSSTNSPEAAASETSSFPSNQQHSARARHALVLQRKDYHVRQVSTTTGQQVWNVTLGTWHALDFSTDDDEYGDASGVELGNDDADETRAGNSVKLLTDHVQDKRETLEELRPLSTRERRQSQAFSMPSIVFSTGKEILAVHPTTRSVLWKLEADSVVASVFGIHKGRWKPLDVLGEEDIVLGQPGGGSGPEEGSPSTFLLLDSRPSSSSSPLEKDYHKLYDAPLMHWFEHYRSRQRLLRAASRGDLKALPSGNEKVEMTISVGGQQMSSSPRYCSPGRLDCSIWQATQLRLPSPSSASTPTDDYDYGMGVGNPASVNMLQPDGLLLSWRIVAILLALLAYAVVLGRIWYLHKKQSWLFAQGASTNQGGTLSSTSALSPPLYAHSQSLEVSALHLRSLPGDATALRRSMSLPDAHRHVRTLSRDNVGHPDRSSSRLSIYAKDDGMLPVQGIPPSVAPTSQVTITKGHASVLTSTSATSERPITTSGVVGPTTVAGTAIPLVQYSRYASEYEELGPLGKGGFGSVYQCKNVLDGREYAIKKVSIRSHKGDDDSRFEQRLERTLREVKILAVLDHPNIVRYFGAWLEIEKGDSGDDVDVDESTRGMSRCYSSTIVTESVSRWQPNPNRFRVGNRIEQDASEDSWSCSYPPTPFQPYHNRRIPLDDCGFIFEESEEDGQNSTTGGESRAVAQTALPLPDSSVVTPSRVSAQDRRPLAGPGAHDEVKPDTVPTAGASILSAVASPRRTARHTLYIQMQLCSQKTVGDFLANAAARQGSIPDGDGGIDIPLALRVFLQVAHAVGHVHDQGLIHRDLKPQNCFMDDSGVVKVGDFGLSRESADTKEDGFLINSSSMASLPAQSSAGEDHTAGVGTRAYASPEQMNGSDYDSSTDVYSLGIILFELVYPMYTGMERNICLSRLRQSPPALPTDWETSIGNAFPSLRDMLLSMVSFDPSRRPSASSVAQHIQSILNEFTIVSLDPSLILQDMILLRVEAEHLPDSLAYTIHAIEESARELGKQVQVVQYGLRSSNAVAIMEFALFYDGPGFPLVISLGRRRSILKVRQVKASTYISS